jgi:inorganic triphosphatase YgiF
MQVPAVDCKADMPHHVAMHTEHMSAADADGDGEGRPIEVEIKLRVTDPAVLVALREATHIAGLGASPVRPAMRFQDHYLDTPDLALRAAGWTLRLRRIGGGGTLASLKGITSPEGATHTRDEIEAPAVFSSDPRRWPDSPVRRRALALLGGRRVAEVAAVRQWRENRTLSDEAGTVIDLSIDRVEVLRGRSVVATWGEVELEIVRGDLAVLAAADAVLVRRRGLVAERRSKGERALELATGRRNPARPPSRHDLPLLRAARAMTA